MFVLKSALSIPISMMFNKLATIFTLATILSLASSTEMTAAEKKKESIKDIFDNDSDFMRGFETGLFLRTKGGTVEEYGCTVPDTGNKQAKSAFDMITKSINTARSTLKMDPIIDEALTVVLELLDGLYYFITILSPTGLKQLDQYCTGMVFGLQGSKLLVKVANTLFNPVGQDGEATGTFDKKKNTAASWMDVESEEFITML